MQWAILSAVLAVGMEYWFRSQRTWELWLILPAIAVNYSIYRLVIGSQSLISAIVLFTAASVILRLVASVFLGEIKTMNDYGRAAAYLVLSMWR